MADGVAETDGVVEADGPRLPVTPRTRIRRVAHKAVGDPAVLRDILDAGLVGHLAAVDGGQPYVLPVAYARDGDRVLFHGSTGSRLFRALATGAPTCFTVTLLDGLVLARSAFETSMHYRSVVALGACRVLRGADKLAALERIAEHAVPGRWARIRPPSNKELAATLVLALDLSEVSVKVSDAPPDDFPEDLDIPTWAGTVPFHTRVGEPVPAPDLRFDASPPDLSAATWNRPS